MLLPFDPFALGVAGHIELKDKSFTETQEFLEVVAREFQRHGCKLTGVCEGVRRAGKYGHRPGNIARDIQRRFERLHEDPASLSEIM